MKFLACAIAFKRQVTILFNGKLGSAAAAFKYRMKNAERVIFDFSKFITKGPPQFPET